MDTNKIRQVLDDLSNGRLDVETALAALKDLPYADLGFARLDFHRTLRTGAAEVIYCENKTPDQVAAIVARMRTAHERVMGTRASPEMAQAVQAQLPEVRYEALPRLLFLENSPQPAPDPAWPLAVVISAGTADLPVAEEAARTLEFLGERVGRAYDVGVAGLHRLLDQRALLNQADVLISVAGMEGALTSVVAGLVSCPVIGAPTSVGYGASFGGLAALLAMLNSCAPGVAVVNINNGFGAAQMAHAILQGMRGYAGREAGA